MFKKLSLIVILFSQFINVFAENPEKDKYLKTPYNSTSFVKQEKFTNEFNSKHIDTKNWTNPQDNGFATWSFVPENVKQENGKLKITMSYGEHTKGKGANQKSLYFKSGLLRSKSKVGYGYYEARLKGAPIWPGTCSAFWLYTLPQEEKANSKKEANEIIYNEIDVVELQQVPRDKNVISCNMHIWTLDEQLKTDRIMAGKYPKLGKNEFRIDNFDGEKDFHVYAVENRPDSVVFYIDNRRVASKPNYFWHKEMYIILSLGLRTPYEKYVGSQRTALPVTEEETSKAGFPCAMEVDYIRSWKRDYSGFKSSEIPYNKHFIKQFEK